MHVAQYCDSCPRMFISFLANPHHIPHLQHSSSILAASHHPELDYLMAVNSVAPPQDPQLLFLLMAQYANANIPGEGVEFVSARLREFGPSLPTFKKRCT